MTRRWSLSLTQNSMSVVTTASQLRQERQDVATRAHQNAELVLQADDVPCC